MFLIIIMGVVLTVGLIGVGLLLMQQEQAPPRPVSHPPGLGPELAPASPRHCPSCPGSVRSWSMTLTSGNAVLYMIIGLFGIGNFIVSLGISIGLGLPPGTCSILFLVGGGVIFFLGLRNWQRVQALEARGQMTQGVIFDRWVSAGKGAQYCVAYYFDLPWGSPGGSQVIWAEVNGQVYRVFQIGDSIPIRYVPDKPQVCRVER